MKDKISCKTKIIVAVVFIAVVFLFVGFYSRANNKVSSGFDELDEYVDYWKEGQKTFFGYPMDEDSKLHDFYEWYTASGLDTINLNNAGDPMADSPEKCLLKSLKGK